MKITGHLVISAIIPVQSDIENFLVIFATIFFPCTTWDVLLHDEKETNSSV